MQTYIRRQQHKKYFKHQDIKQKEVEKHKTLDIEVVPISILEQDTLPPQ